MKKEIDPKAAIIGIVVIVLIAIGGVLFATRTPGDRSGPAFDVDLKKWSAGGKGAPGMPSGFKPGQSVQQVQAEAANGGIQGGMGGPGAH